MTTRQELTDPFAAAVAEAQSELDEATSSDPLDSQPEDETEELAEVDQAVGEESEQAESELEPPAEQATEDSEDELFGDLEVEEVAEEAQAESETPDSFTLPGIDEPVSLQELKDGYLRQADYTRKTQALAESRAAAEKADAFWQALQERPQEVVRQLAEHVGLVEQGATPVKVVDLPFRTAEDIQAEVDQKVEEALKEHPDLVAARDVLAEKWVSDEFARIEQAYGVTLGPKSRELVLRTADAKGVTDLEMVYQSLVAKQQELARKRDALKSAAPAKPTGKATPQADIEEINSFEDAVAAARAQLGE